MANQQTDSSLIHRELQRKSQDVHRIFNPTDKDYNLSWDGYLHKIPANSTADLQTYLVDKYLREMTDKILRERQENAVKEENERRRSRGEKEMEKYQGGEQPILEGKFAIEKGVANPEVRMQIYQELYMGIVKEYGIEKVQKETIETVPTTHEQLMGKILSSRRTVSDGEPPILSKTPTTPLESMNQFQLRKVAKDRGIKTDKTDKKKALIEKISQTA
jgi:hypothetical protein